MKLSQLNFDFPEELIAQHPVENSRVMLVDSSAPVEISKEKLLEQIKPGDVFIINNTKVIKRRVYAQTPKEFEFLFVEQLATNKWTVLCKASQAINDTEFTLPDNVKVKIIENGIPQVVEVSKPLNNNYFESHGEMPLPPYIQKARHNIHNTKEDQTWYQTDWAEVMGSQAAPTASLHFKTNDLEQLKNRGVQVEQLTLHVGLGTFLPVRVDDLSEHKMHHEYVEITQNTWQSIQNAKKNERKIWALGTTVARALEACALKHLPATKDGFQGTTDLLIQEGFSFQIVDFLLTNFHQPQSTLLALVCGFVSRDRVMNAYQWAIQHKYRLFSYGDLSVWSRPQ